MPNQDTLWKGIIEDLAEDFLRFFFAEYADEIDFSKKFVFLDKELLKLFPEAKTSHRHADKLMKIWLKSGQSHCILLHIEVQGYTDKQFAERMFQGLYRIMDKFKQQVTAIAIYTNTDRNNQPEAFEFEFMGASFKYQFNVFRLMDYSPEHHPLANSNFFALVLEAAKLDMSRKKDDKSLTAAKLEIVRKMLIRDPNKEKVRKSLNFVRYYTRYENKQESANFERQLDKLIQNRKNMGIEEAILTEARKEGEAKGLKKGLKQGMEKGIFLQKQQFILKGIEQGLSISILSALTELTEVEVEAIIHQSKGG